MNTAVITPAESDSFLSDKTSWLALSEAEKEGHIAKASVYAQTQWTCSEEVVWEDDSATEEVEEEAIPDLIKEAVAWYAYASSKNNLFGDPANDDPAKGNLRLERKKLGELEKSVEYYQGGAQKGIGTARHTGYPDALMQVYCEMSFMGGSISLVRT
jgi:hypothetical protein